MKVWRTLRWNLHTAHFPQRNNNSSPLHCGDQKWDQSLVCLFTYAMSRKGAWVHVCTEICTDGIGNAHQWWEIMSVGARLGDFVFLRCWQFDLRQMPRIIVLIHLVERTAVGIYGIRRLKAQPKGLGSMQRSAETFAGHGASILYFRRSWKSVPRHIYLPLTPKVTIFEFLKNKIL